MTTKSKSYKFGYILQNRRFFQVKKVVILSAATLLTMSFTNVTSAQAIDEFLVKKGEKIEVKNEKEVSKEEISKKIKEIEQNFNENELDKIDKNIATQQLSKVEKFIGSNQALINPSLAPYDENKAKLRTGNFIESILDVNEGLSEYELYRIGSANANTARDAAANAYPNDTMLQDAYRHFTWNFLSTKDVGQIKTRTGTINHEWGVLLLNSVLSYYDDQYNKYVKNGTSDPANKALSDAILLIPNLKYDLVTVCKSNYNFFKGYFEVSNIMDLHNNCYGRAYAVNYGYLSYEGAFYTAKAAQELILSESAVGDYQYKYVWQNQWYTY